MITEESDLEESWKNADVCQKNGAKQRRSSFGPKIPQKKIYIPAPSKGCQINLKGWLIDTP